MERILSLRAMDAILSRLNISPVYPEYQEAFELSRNCCPEYKVGKMQELIQLSKKEFMYIDEFGEVGWGNVVYEQKRKGLFSKVLFARLECDLPLTFSQDVGTTSVVRKVARELPQGMADAVCKWADSKGIELVYVDSTTAILLDRDHLVIGTPYFKTDGPKGEARVTQVTYFENRKKKVLKGLPVPKKDYKSVLAEVKGIMEGLTPELQDTYMSAFQGGDAIFNVAEALGMSTDEAEAKATKYWVKAWREVLRETFTEVEHVKGGEFKVSLELPE